MLTVRISRLLLHLCIFIKQLSFFKVSCEPPGLNDEGVSCSDITDVVITHGHSDHCGCLSLFESARFFMDQDCAENFCCYSALQVRLFQFRQTTVRSKSIINSRATSSEVKGVFENVLS